MCMWVPVGSKDFRSLRSGAVNPTSPLGEHQTLLLAKPFLQPSNDYS